MTEPSPYKIYEDFKNRKIDKKGALDLLISLIDDDHEYEEKTRILGIKFLGLIHPKEKKIFDFIENILISDLNEEMREHAANVLILNFPEKASKPITWVLKHDKDDNFLFSIIKSLEKSGDNKLKSILKIKKYVNFKGNIIFPSESNDIINLNNKNIDKIEKIKNLESLIDLKKIFLNYNQIVEIKGLETLKDLKSLHLQGNQIDKINDLSKLKKLESLYLNNNAISKIEGISGLKNLKSLIIFDNNISEIENLEKFSNLEVLNLRNNQISEIKGLKQLSNLKRLDLSNNQISEIKNLENLTKLEFLDLSHNKIDELKGLEHLGKLKFLDVRNNKIKDVKGLEKLKKLQHLYIGFNEISDIKDKDILKNIKVLDIKNTEEFFIPNSLWDVFPDKLKNVEKLRIPSVKVRDIKFFHKKVDSQSIVGEISNANDYLEFFTDSSWMIVWNNNEYEIFRLSKLGDIKWLQRSKKTYFR